MIIAIDGPAGSGKTTTAHKVALNLGFIHINTGAMYRGIALKFIREKINLENRNDIELALKNTRFHWSGSNSENILMDGQDITLDIVSSRVTRIVSRISAIPEVRNKLVQNQREIAKDQDVVLEGRDIGTVVFPEAEYKFFLLADINVRAKRRMKQMKYDGEDVSIDEVLFFLKKRDKQDSSRIYSPLKKAEDAIELDTTYLSIDQQVNFIINIVNKN